MKSYWLNKQNNKKIIVFFAGWSFDETPFKFLDCSDYDVLFIYDYNEISNLPELTNFNNYEEKNLICWSMGVFAAYLLKDLFKDFNLKIAINGTITPVHNEYGIPVKLFELTLKHAKIGLEGKFYQNVFQTEDEYQKYTSAPVQRTIDNRVSELTNLYELIKNKSITIEKFYDKAIVSDFDKIIPPQNQINSHNSNGVQIVELECGHFPFYEYKSWKEILDVDR